MARDHRTQPADDAIGLQLLDPVLLQPIYTWKFEDQDILRIGRSPDNQVVLGDTQISRKHCELRREPAGWRLVNFGRHGTFIGDRKIESEVVPDGTIFRLGVSGPILCVAADIVKEEDDTHLTITEAGLAERAAKLSDMDQGTQVALARLRAEHEKMKLDIEQAAKVQRSLLPSPKLSFSAIDYAWVHEPCAKLAGDTLNIFELDDRHIVLYILDVAGHGVPAALMSVTLHHVLAPPTSQDSLLFSRSPESSENIGLSPAEVVGRLNRLFPMNQRTMMYFTLLYGVLDLEKHEFRFVSAGHPGPVHLSPGKPPVVIDSTSFAVGWFEEAIYREKTIKVEPGDRLFLYSDGIIDAKSVTGDQFGRKRFMDCLERTVELSLSDSLTEMVGDIRAWCEAVGIADDVSSLAVAIK